MQSQGVAPGTLALHLMHISVAIGIIFVLTDEFHVFTEFRFRIMFPESIWAASGEIDPQNQNRVQSDADDKA